MMNRDTILSAFGIVMGISMCTVVIRATRDYMRGLAGRLDLANVWTEVQQYVVALVSASHKQRIARSYDHTRSAVQAATAQRLTVEDSRSDDEEDADKSLRSRGIDSNTLCRYLSRRVSSRHGHSTLCARASR